MAVAGATVLATDGLGRAKAETKCDDQGKYSLEVEGGAVYSFVAQSAGFEAAATSLRQVDADIEALELSFGKLANASEVLTVTAHVSEPAVDQRDAAVFNKTLFTRDDQIFQTLGAGLSLGQHAGGGKSLEVRRFGFNLDHGGTGGGLKVIMDGVQLNSISGGHAHGYLGALKGISPELVEDVALINGPFNAQYGDFSGLGVVNINTRQESADGLMARVQFGQYNTRRFFGSYSPQWNKTRALLSIENSYTDGPYQRKLQYKRNNLTGVWSRSLTPTQTLTFRMYGNTNDSFAAGQLPIDQIDAGKMDRFGFVDPTDGNASQSGTFAGFYTKSFADGSTFKVDGMANRLLFDLFSNFTFFLDHPDTGDGFTQHDSRLQEAANAQYEKPHTFGNAFGTLFTGVNFLGNQINLQLLGRQGRVNTDLRTHSQTNIANTGFYGQENLVLMAGKLRLDGGLRYDTFSYRIQDRLFASSPRQSRTGGAWQPKAAVAYTPSMKIPFTVYANYGRAVTSTNARALISEPQSPLTALTDFSMVGWSLNYTKFSIAGDAFLIDRTLETIYAADDGSTEFTTPSRSSGWEAKTSYQFTPWLSWNGSVTKVMNAFYRGTNPRIYIDRAPHFTAYSAFTVSNYKGWSGSLRVRAINRYILNGEGNGGARVPGHTVWDFSASRSINRYFDLNIAVDNLLDKSFYETFEMYTSALRGQDPLERVHGTPGYPRTVMVGVTIHLFPKAQ